MSIKYRPSNKILCVFSILAAVVFAPGAFAQDCTNPDGARGTVLYNSDFGVYQGCTRQGWTSFHPPSCPTGADCGIEPLPSCNPADLEWATHVTPHNVNYQSVAYGNGRFVASSIWGVPSHVAVSTDGINWTAHNVPRTGALGFGNNRFVMLRESTLLVSDNGETWTEYAGALPHIFWDSVVYGPNGFVAVSANSGVSRAVQSDDGISWNVINLDAVAPGGRWTKVTYGNGRYVATCGWCYDGSGSGIMSSTDGVNWTAHAETQGCGSWSMAYGNGLFVGASCWQQPFVHSTNGTSWTTGGWTGTQPNIHNIAYGPGIGFIGTGDSGATISLSEDGMNWVNRAAPPGIPWFSYPNAAIYANGMFIVVSDGRVLRGACPG